MGPMRTRVRQSLLRPLLLLGGERELVIATGMIAAVLAFSLGDVFLAAIGFAIWGCSLFVLQRMAKHDPQLFKVYIRHVNKKIYYPAHAHMAAIDPEVKKQQ